MKIMRGVLAVCSVTGIALLVGASAAAAWSLVDDCQPQEYQKWQAFKEDVRGAKPGSPLYVPYPFPQTDDEVIADYLYHYRQMWSGARYEELPEEERTVFAGVEKGTLRFIVVRVENWTPLRCRAQKKVEFYFLLRIFITDGGREISRAALTDAGFFAMGAPLTTDAPITRNRLPSIAEAQRSLAAELKIQGELAQYVATFGTTALRCPPVAPCAVFRVGAETYLLPVGGGWFVIPENRRELSADLELATIERRNDLLRSLTPEERLVSLGGQHFTVARLIKEH